MISILHIGVIFVWFYPPCAFAQASNAPSSKEEDAGSSELDLVSLDYFIRDVMDSSPSLSMKSLVKRAKQAQLESPSHWTGTHVSNKTVRQSMQKARDRAEATSAVVAAVSDPAGALDTDYAVDEYGIDVVSTTLSLISYYFLSEYGHRRTGCVPQTISKLNQQGRTRSVTSHVLFHRSSSSFLC